MKNIEKVKFYTIDISRCQQINKKNEILEIFQTALKKFSRLRVSRIDSTKTGLYSKKNKIISDFVKLKEIKRTSYLILEKLNQKLAFDVPENEKLEFLIDYGSRAFFFCEHVRETISRTDSTVLSVKFPGTLFAMNRRDYFRFTPSPEHPVTIEFTHANITYEFYIGEISGSGFSLILKPEKRIPFNENDIISDITISFREETISGLKALIRRIANKDIDGEKNTHIGLEFLDINETIRDKLIKNIFAEHRKYLKIVQDRYIFK